MKTIFNIISAGVLLILSCGTISAQASLADFANKQNISVTQVNTIGNPGVVEDYHITYTQTWELPNAMTYQNIVIDPGVTLTIKNTTLGFPQYGYISVRATGKLILENSRLTNSSSNPNTRWMGMFVAGNPFATAATAQGLIDIQNSVIENAIDGVSTYLVMNEMCYDNSYGGSVKGLNSRFTNNLRDLNLISIPSNIRSYTFKMCTFEILANNPLTAGSSRASLYDVNAHFYGCTFKYYPHGAIQSYGISSYRSGLTVGEYCNQSGSVYVDPCPTSLRIPSVFEGFLGGISADAGGNTSKYITIGNSKFANNSTSVFIKGTHYAYIAQCEFLNSNISGYPSGVSLSACKYYTVKNNVFRSTVADADKAGIGVQVSGSGDGAHAIFRNEFYNLKRGIWAIGNNSGLENYVDGLKMNCNRFYSCRHDIYMSGTTLSGSENDFSTKAALPSVMYYQGQPQTPPTINAKQLVRNSYSAICGVGEGQNRWYISDARKNIIHPCHQGGATDLRPQPACSNLAVNVITYNVPFNFATDCAEPSGPWTETSLSNEITTLGNDINIIKTQANITNVNEILSSYHESNASNLSVSDNVKAAEEVVYKEFELQTLVSQKIRMLLENGSVEEAEKVMSEYGRNETKVSQLSEAIESGDLSTAKRLLPAFENESGDVEFCKRLSLEIAYKQAVNEKKTEEASALLKALLDFRYSTPTPNEEIGRYYSRNISSLGMDKEPEFTIFPNPAQDHVTFTYKGDLEGLTTVEIHDITGRLIDRVVFSGNQYQYSIDKLTQSIYIATFKINGLHMGTQKIILDK